MTLVEETLDDRIEAMERRVAVARVNMEEAKRIWRLKRANYQARVATLNDVKAGLFARQFEERYPSAAERDRECLVNDGEDFDAWASRVAPLASEWETDRTLRDSFNHGALGWNRRYLQSLARCDDPRVRGTRFAKWYENMRFGASA